MMILRSTPPSPFGRKVKLAASVLGLSSDIEIEPADTNDAADTIRRQNPLGKIPTLVLEDGSTLYDSRVIVEYLDTVSPVSRLIPEPSRQRIAVKRWEALADGLCDAAISMVLEGRRPARQQSKEWIDRQRRKVEAGVAELARELGDKTWCNGEGYTLADIATGCALGYLEFRKAAIDYAHDFTNLKKLAERLSKRAAFAETAPA